MQKLFSIIYFVATIAFLSIIASADEGQSRAPKMIRLIKPLTTMKNRGNTGNLNPAVPDAFALWTPKRTRAAVPIESSSDGPALTDQDDIHQLLTVPEDHWKREGAVQKAAGRFLNSFPKDASDHRTYLDNKVHHGLRHIMKRMESISDCMEGFTFNSCASCCGFKFSTRGDLITAVNDYDVSLYGQMKCWDVSSITDLTNLFSGVSLN